MGVFFSIDRAFDFAQIDVYNTYDIFIRIFVCMCACKVVSKRKG